MVIWEIPVEPLERPDVVSGGMMKTCVTARTLCAAVAALSLIGGASGCITPPSIPARRGCNKKVKVVGVTVYRRGTTGDGVSFWNE